MNERDKIIAEIAADERPVYYEDRESWCRYCKEDPDVVAGVYSPATMGKGHTDSCIWERAKKWEEMPEHQKNETYRRGVVDALMTIGEIEDND